MTHMFERKWSEEKKRWELFIMDEEQWRKVVGSGRYGSSQTSWILMEDGLPKRIVGADDVSYFEIGIPTEVPAPAVQATPPPAEVPPVAVEAAPLVVTGTGT